MHCVDNDLIFQCQSSKNRPSSKCSIKLSALPLTSFIFQSSYLIQYLNTNHFIRPRQSYQNYKVSTYCCRQLYLVHLASSSSATFNNKHAHNEASLLTCYSSSQENWRSASCFGWWNPPWQQLSPFQIYSRFSVCVLHLQTVHHSLSFTQPHSASEPSATSPLITDLFF